MRRSRFAVVALFAVVMLFSVGSAPASVCPGSNVIQDPPSFQWAYSGGYWSGTLELGKATLTIGNDTLTTRAYRQQGGNFSIPGPTLKMTPGQTYVLTFKNLLPYAPPSPVMNDLKDPDISNLHTHGLHVSGETPADDVMRLINGGFCGDYVYQVPADHMGGTLWYHAHHHGSTYLQVSGGAFGLLLVDDSGDNIPPIVAGMTERQLAIAYLDPAVAGAGGDTLISGTLAPTWTVNGRVRGSLCTPANEWQHWRVLVADRHATLKTLSVGSSCEAVLLARDGVWRTVAPLTLANNSIQLTGASRADLAVRCSADSTVSVDGTVVADVVTDGSVAPDLGVGPYADNADGSATWSAWRPSYLRDLRGETQVENRTVNMGARTINGAKFDAEVPTFQIPATSIQEWTIKGATQHPFHQHVYHFQVQDGCGPFEAGEYYDTLAASSCNVRFDLNPATSSVYDGRTIMHCHILLHEDEGAMGWSDVQGGFPPPRFPSSSQQAFYECAGCTPTETAEVTCNDGVDNDCDGLIDAADPTNCQTSCSAYGDRTSCNNDPGCRWDAKTKTCLVR